MISNDKRGAPSNMKAEGGSLSTRRTLEMSTPAKLGGRSAPSRPALQTSSKSSKGSTVLLRSKQIPEVKVLSSYCGRMLFVDPRDLRSRGVHALEWQKTLR